MNIVIGIRKCKPSDEVRLSRLPRDKPCGINPNLEQGETPVCILHRFGTQAACHYYGAPINPVHFLRFNRGIASDSKSGVR